MDTIMINVLIADDDAIIREGLKLILSSQADISVAGQACSGNEAVDICRSTKVDVALLDIRMPDSDGLTAAETMIREQLCIPLLLTTFDEEEFILRALKSGISGYILKNSPAERIINAVRTVSTGGTVFQEDILDCIRSRIDEKGSRTELFKLLSPRETEVARLIAEGMSNQEIADKLYLSNGTVRNHISTILEKTGLEHRTQIAVQWLRG